MLVCFEDTKLFGSLPITRCMFTLLPPTGAKAPKMTKETLKALLDSVAHWDRLASGTRSRLESIGTKDCALCNRFFHGPEGLCDKCPVKLATGEILCQNTPFRRASENCAKYGISSSQFMNSAKLQYNFLVSLLPVKHRKDFEQEKVETT